MWGNRSTVLYSAGGTFTRTGFGSTFDVFVFATGAGSGVAVRAQLERKIVYDTTIPTISRFISKMIPIIAGLLQQFYL